MPSLLKILNNGRGSSQKEKKGGTKCKRDMQHIKIKRQAMETHSSSKGQDMQMTKRLENKRNYSSKT
jgi:hypothetical protein